ncbi:STAS domain-containing protein [Zobellella taiwanensis]|jgi:phospholipid transport system transporter-binding protein|uniref:Anti-anti-sigma factor n=1 Tax=Zobellella taiwanensis TaxID=347535 RepID=A0A2P7QQD1_9GAMM|nr:STAS domain-containing protein [Zobellella taiwanensis]PSJ40150.1 anti-anti-sigma factor [Zobellella taiwanensis]
MKLTRPLIREQLPAYWAERHALFAEDNAELGEVEQIDSVGLAFLVQWSQALSAAGRGLTLSAPPASFYPLADLYGVSELFTLADNDSGSQHGSE